MEKKSKRSSNRHCFGLDLEDGEVSDIEGEDKAEKKAEQDRKDDFIREWTQKQNANTANGQKEEDEGDMEVESEDESKESRIDTKPVAMTITFHDESFARTNRGVIETQMVMKFGPDMVDSNDNCIFVLHEHKSVEIIKSVAAPLSVLTIVFHDEEFCAEFSTFMVNLCESMFGVSKTTSHDPWLIEVFQNDFLNFELDATPYGRDSHTFYNKKNVDVETKKSSGGQRGTCFNCLGSHSLRDCREPRDHTTINANRRKFMDAKAKKPGRYHVEVEKYSEFIPGQISDNLREALGVGPTELPLHIYRMRKYGYPPGWLLEAKIAHSGVSVYGKDGVVFEEGDEDGEIVDEGKDQFDIKKLVVFPGLNAPLPEGVIDEHEKYHCPPMSEEDSFDRLKGKLAPNAMQAYKRKTALRLNDDGSESGDNDTAGQSDSQASSTDGPSTSQAACLATPKVSSKPLTVDLGTPVLLSHSPFSKLPDRDKFATDVSDVINFENLPDSIGTYEKMIGSIAKIREYNAQNNSS